MEGGFHSDQILRCPADLVWVVEPKTLVRLSPDRHLEGRSIGRSSFTYIGPDKIQNLLEDMQAAKVAHMRNLLERVREASRP